MITMKQENLEKSITLLGPPCVGKTLIGDNLSQKLNMPVISIDDLILLIGEEMDGTIDTSAKQQRWFANNLKQQILLTPEFKETLINPKYEKVELKLIQSLIDMYNYYHSLLGDFKPFYSIIEQHRSTLSSANSTDYAIASFNHITNQILKVIFEKLDQPLIIDAPGAYGWQFVQHLEDDTKTKLELYLNLIASNTQADMNAIINSTQSVLLLPGQDYHTRSSNNKDRLSELILNNLDNFIETDLSLPTNELFYPSNSNYLKQRRWLDAREFLVKDKLKNRAEIANMCDEIYQGLNDLKQSQILSN